MDRKIMNFIDRKADDLNPQGDLAGYVSSKIAILNDHIEEKSLLSLSEVDSILSELVGFFTTSLHIPIDIGMKFLRARSYRTNYQEVEVSLLSYIPKQLKEKTTLGRLNKKGQPVYYGCIYFDQNSGVNVSFSESNAKVGDSVNILRSKSTDILNVYFVGIYDFVLRQCKPRFMSQETFEYFTQVYNYQEKQLSESAFLAHQLCDAFFSDILRRKEYGKLYEVTSLLFSIFSDGGETDGIIYTSVKSEGDPVVALKTSAVDAKLVHESCDSFRITYDYGYAKYRANHTHRGSIDNNKIIWVDNT